MAAHTANRPISNTRPGLLSALARVDDGAMLRLVFVLMLIGTVAVIGIDYWEREQKSSTVSEYDPAVAPILPAVARPELDPANPAFSPDSHITTDPELLGAPMDLILSPGNVLLLQGTIGPGAGELLATELALRGEYVQTISLNSPGGIVQEALILGELIREGGYATTVSDGSLCASSCPLVLAAGVARTTQPEAVVGVHQIYQSLADSIDPRNSAAQAMSDAQALTGMIGRYLNDMGIDPRLWFHALETPPDKLYYLTPEEMKEFGLSNAEG